MILHARHFTTLEELTPYSERWNELLQHSEANSIFLTWEWLSSWCTIVARDISLFTILVFDEDNQVQAILPLYQSSFILLRFIPYKYLRFMGDCHCGGEYADLIVAPEIEITDVGHCIKAYLYKHRINWDCLYITNIAGWTGALHRLNLNKKDTLFSRERKTIFSSILLPTNIEKFDSELLGSRSAVIRRQKKKLAQTGQISFGQCECQKDLPSYLNNLFTLHKKRWESAGQQGSFAKRPLMQCFYADFAPKAFDKGWLKIFTLKRDGVILAIQIGYIYEDAFYQMQEGFDPSETLGLGNILRYFVICWCIEHGITKYDFLGGNEDHKLTWGAQKKIGYNLFWAQKSLKNFPLIFANIWPSGRYITEGPPISFVKSHN